MGGDIFDLFFPTIHTETVTGLNKKTEYGEQIVYFWFFCRSIRKLDAFN